MSDVQITKVHAVEWHRNGVGGLGFHVVLFDEATEGRMMAVDFGPEADAATDSFGVIAVFQLDKLAAGDVAFGSNSWRGDHYTGPVRAVITAAEARGETGKLGPFSLPPQLRRK